MRQLLYRRLQVGCLCALCAIAGALAESRFVKESEIAPVLPGRTAAEEAINMVVPEIDLEAVPFSQAVEKARELSPVPIIVRWEKLAAAGLDAKSPVTFRAPQCDARAIAFGASHRDWKPADLQGGCQRHLCVGRRLHPGHDA